MNKTISINTETLELILKHIENLTKDVSAIKAKLFDEEPPYGSAAWWKKEEKEADEDIKQGRVHGPFQTEKELQVFLDSIK